MSTLLDIQEKMKDPEWVKKLWEHNLAQVTRSLEFERALERIAELSMSQCQDYKHMAEWQKQIAIDALGLE